MGFGVTAAHIILFIAVASAGTTLIDTVYTAFEDVGEIYRVREDRLEAIEQSSISLVSSPSWSNGQKRWTFSVDNTGGVALRLDRVEMFVDGSIVNEPSTVPYYVTLEINGATTSNLWLPGDTIDVVIDIDDVEPGTPEPTNLWIMTEYGASAQYRG